MALDIGMILFRDILKMMEYPNYPFTGVILNDLVMFFLIPTIFIILVLYMAIGRLVGTHSGLRLLVGVGAYLFIIFGGYYGTFARIAGPYFIFLIFILGLLYFFIDHFSKKPSGGGGASGYSSGGGYSSEDGNRKQYKIGIPALDPRRRNFLTKQLELVNKDIMRLEESRHKLLTGGSSHGVGDVELKLIDLHQKRQQFEDELAGKL